MVNQQLALLQPNIHQFLKNAFSNHKLPHSFLISGNNQKLKLETAFFIAQSILENDLACETCNTCRRVKELTYSDLIYIDGTTNLIKKEEIDDLQRKFMLSANEIAGKKIYIINGIENTSNASLNSLLKFLEEPNGDQTYAILITSAIDKVLPTIISRCVVLDFKQQDTTIVQNQYQAITNDFESYYLANTFNYFDEAILEDEAYQNAIYFFKAWIKKYPDNLDAFLFEVSNELLLNKDKDLEIKSMVLLLELMAIYLKDLFAVSQINEDWYNKEVNRVKQYNKNTEDILFNTLQIKDKVNKNYDYRLLMEKLIYIMKVR